jgi:small-conductance mechanosensitive channel
MSENNLPPPPAYTPPAAPAPAPVAGRPTSTLAIISLVSGILGWTLLPWLGSLAAVVTGHLARAEIRRSAGGMDGDGLAITGLVLGYAVIILSLLALLAIIFFFGGLALFLGAVGLSGQG